MKHLHMEALGRSLIIVNPTAQSGAAAIAAERLQRFLTMYCHESTFTIARTEHPCHATQIARGAVGYDTVLALGGDGVIHEVACGLMQIAPGQRPVLGVIPVGSGNDFARTLGLTDVSGNDFTPLTTSSPIDVDVLRVIYEPVRPHDAEPQVTYALQTISFGLDALIAIDTHKMRKLTGLSGTPLYMASGLKAFGRGYRDFPVHASFDEGPEQALRAIVFAIQNGPTYGSGFQICPRASITDGLLDICYAAGPAPRAVALPVFLSAKNGRHVDDRHMHLQRAHRVDLVFPRGDYPIQLDGEKLSARAMSIEVLPGALKVLKPR